MRGERSDGHDYLLDAIQRGATGLLIEGRILNALPQNTLTTLMQSNTTIVIVNDTRAALREYRHVYFARMAPIVIAVTGSVGKTSIKVGAWHLSLLAVSRLLGVGKIIMICSGYHSLGRLEKRHEYAVVELGCDDPGEITRLCQIVQPHIGVLTNISPVQMQYLHDTEQLAQRTPHPFFFS